MKKNTTYIIIAVIVFLVVGYIFWPQKPMMVENEGVTTDEIVASSTTTGTTQKTIKKPGTTVKTTPKNTYIVSYTTKGFEPSELQVPKGSSVKFVNKTNTSMRIFASENAKPPYSELNQPKALGLNGEYVFNFVYSGVWEYYNSLKPSDKANIVVY